MRILRWFLKALLAVLVLAGGASGAYYLIDSRPKLAPAAPKERIWPVSAVTVEIADAQPDLRLYGEIVAGRSVELRALVAGQILIVGSRFRDGGMVKSGDMLVTIDAFDYQADLDERRAQLAEARARTKEIEARQQTLRAALRRDREIVTIQRRQLARVEKLRKSGSSTGRALDNARLDLTRQLQVISNRENEIVVEQTRLAQQQALIDRHKVNIRRTERDLQRTRLLAPFDGFLYDITAEIGKRISVNDRVARLIDARRLEARIHLSDSEYGRLISGGEKLIGRQARVVWHIGGRGLELKAVIDRIAPTINAASGGVDAYARLLASSLDLPIRPGAFVTISLPDRRYVQVARVPDSALFGQDTVYVIKDNRLERRRVRVIARQANSLLLRGELRDGDRVVTNRFAEIGPGVLVKIR